MQLRRRWARLSIPQKSLILACCFVLSVWLVPFVRCFRFLKWAEEYYADTQSINAFNDFHYALSLAIAYFLCVLVSFGLLFLAIRMKRYWLLLILVLPLWSTIQVIIVAPEEPIHLFPAMSPFGPVCWHLFAAVLALTMVGLMGLRKILENGNS